MSKAKTYCVEQGGGLVDPSLPGDVGHNLPHPNGTLIPAESFRQVHTGIHVEFPPGQWGIILARSSSNHTGKLIVLPGVIDQGYRGELTAMVHNVAHRTLGDRVANALHRWTGGRFGRTGSVNDITIPPGKAMSQLVFFQICNPEIERVTAEADFTGPTLRGTNGYGHTDKRHNGIKLSFHTAHKGNGS